MEEFAIEFLDVSPMIEALRIRPMDFEWDGSWLHHLPSDHRFKVDEEGDVRIDARCDCAILRVRREQGRALWNAFQIWEAAYWRPVEINKEFARHFSPPNWLQRLYRGSRVILRRALHHHNTLPSFVATSPDNPSGSKMDDSPWRDSNDLDTASSPFLSGAALGAQPPISLVSMGPNSSHVSSLNLLSWTCLIGAKSIGLVLIVIPGRRFVVRKPLRFAASFITLSRVRLSPHCFST